MQFILQPEKLVQFTIGYYFCLVIITAIMRRDSKKRKEMKKTLLYFLDLFNEIQFRDNVEQTLRYIEDEIDTLVEKLKRMY